MSENTMRHTLLLVAESDLDLEQALFGSNELSLSEVLGACTIREPDASDIPDSLIAERREGRAAEAPPLRLTAETLGEAAEYAREAAYRLRRGVMASPGLASGLKQDADRADALAAALNAAAEAAEGNATDAGGTTFELELPEGWEVYEASASAQYSTAEIRDIGGEWLCSLDDEDAVWYGRGPTPSAALLDALRRREKDNAGGAGCEKTS